MKIRFLAAPVRVRGLGSLILTCTGHPCADSLLPSPLTGFPSRTGQVHHLSTIHPLSIHQCLLFPFSL